MKNKTIQIAGVILITLNTLALGIFILTIPNDTPTCTTKKQKGYITDNGGYYVTSTTFLWVYPDGKKDSIRFLELDPNTVNVGYARPSLFFDDFDIDGNEDLVRIWMRPKHHIEESEYDQIPQIWMNRDKKTGAWECDHESVQPSKFLIAKFHEIFELRDKALIELALPQ